MKPRSLEQIRDWRNMDAFNRLRVSSPVSQFEYQNQYGLGTIVWGNKLEGTGAITHEPNGSTALMSTGGTSSGAKVTRQTRKYFRYTPGKSLLCTLTFSMGARIANGRQRVGYFDAQNGVFLEQNSAGLFLVLRSYTSGEIIETRVPQSDWKLDSLDGQGVLDDNGNAINIDVTKAQIFFLDIQWLGVGSVRCGFEIDGVPVYVHRFDNANITGPQAYMTTANLPIRYEVENTGTTASAVTMRQICATVVTENGGAELQDYYTFSANNGITPVSVTTRRSVLNIRPKATFNGIVNRGQITPNDVDITTASQNILWEIVVGGALGGTPSWTSANDNSIAEYDVAGTTVTGGIVIASGYAVAGGGAQRGLLQSVINEVYPLTIDMDGLNPVILSVVCTAFTGTASVAAAINWKEVY